MPEVMMISQKLFIKGGTSLSLHERFTRLSTEPIGGGPPEPISPPKVRNKSHYKPGNYYSYLESGPNHDGGHPQEQELFKPRGHFNSIQDARDQDGEPFFIRDKFNMRQESERERRNGLFRTALKIKKRAIVHRLGIRRQDSSYYRRYNHNFPYFPNRRGRMRTRGSFFKGNRGGRRFGNNRWTSTNSLASDGTGLGRPWRRGGRGRGRRGGFRRNFSRQPNVTREQLDNELDNYMKDTKSVLDKELDNYMQQS